MTRASRFAAARSRVEETRPQFSGERLVSDSDGAGNMTTATLAQVDDEGALEVLDPIREDEMDEFVSWVRDVWGV